MEVEFEGVKRLRDRYYKDQPSGTRLISGLSLPKDSDGVVRNKEFIDCDFHPNCVYVTFENCTFVGCEKPS